MAGPDDRTRRLDPARPPEGGYRETEHVATDPGPFHHELMDRVRSLQRWLAVVGVIALAGLGVALYAALASDEEGGDGRGASRESVSNLRDRVDTLEQEVDDRASDDSVSELRDQQEQLEQQVSDLSEQAGDSSGAEQAQQTAEELQGEVEELQQRLDAVEGGANDTGGTGSP